MSNADSARLRAPYGMGRAARKPRELRSGYDRRYPTSGPSNAIPLVFVGLVVLGLGAFVGYLVAENRRLQSAAQAAATTPPTTPRAKAPVARKTTEKGKSTDVAAPEKVPSGQAMDTPKTGRESTTETAALKEARTRKRRAAFLGLGVSSVEDYVSGSRGHWTLAQDVWAVEVSEIKQKADRNWHITFGLVSVLKGEPREKPETLTINSINPWREFKLPPGESAKGGRFVCFLTKDSSFFILSEADFQTVKAEGL